LFGQIKNKKLVQISFFTLQHTFWNEITQTSFSFYIFSLNLFWFTCSHHFLNLIIIIFLFPEHDRNRQKCWQLQLKSFWKKMFLKFFACSFLLFKILQASMMLNKVSNFCKILSWGWFLLSIDDSHGSIGFVNGKFLFFN
jgi:hypothetical protein